MWSVSGKIILDGSRVFLSDIPVGRCGTAASSQSDGVGFDPGWSFEK
jgi:hypothetical protein